jgi:hypothetical protein
MIARYIIVLGSPLLEICLSRLATAVDFYLSLPEGERTVDPYTPPDMVNYPTKFVLCGEYADVMEKEIVSTYLLPRQSCVAIPETTNTLSHLKAARAYLEAFYTMTFQRRLEVVVCTSTFQLARVFVMATDLFVDGRSCSSNALKIIHPSEPVDDATRCREALLLQQYVLTMMYVAR